ncbi:MAG: carbon-nitrogen hydrolase family protein [Desulfobacca sp.]|nr:carbon-nitrogen hydrolase family protein [Desulfobacca sp.]
MKIDSTASGSENGFIIIERAFSSEDRHLSLGIANLHAVVPDIEANKDKMLRALEVFKAKKVNLAIFPEFSLSGYFWEDEPRCWRYMEQAVIENNTDWVDKHLQPYLGDQLCGIIFNTVRQGPNHKFFNTSFLLCKSHDYCNPNEVYDKIFLPPLERIFTNSGNDDRLIVDEKHGRFGFTTCYDILFSQLVLEYAKIDEVDAIIQIASWRSLARRDYPGMNVGSDVYYGNLWDMVMPAVAATNQVWIIACNAVGEHGITGAHFWGGSGLWAPSGLKLLQGSNINEELLIIHNIDLREQRKREKDDFNYAFDFGSVYRPIEGKRAFTRIED